MHERLCQTCFKKSTRPFYSLCGDKWFNPKSNVWRNNYIFHQSGISTSQHLNKTRLHLDKNGSQMLGSIFTKEICKIVNWQNNWNILGIFTEEGNSEKSFESQKLSNCVKLLKSMRSKNLNKLVFARLNINSIRNKFEFLVEQVKGKRDVLMISETKIDASFTIANFVITGYSTPYRLDRNSNGGEILLYVREDTHLTLWLL